MKAGLSTLIGLGITVAVCGVGLCYKGNFVDAAPVVVSVCEPEQTQITVGFSLPAAIEGTDLVAESLTSYEGPYLEDGTYEEVGGVAALVVRNTSRQTMEHVSITVSTGHRLLRFKGSWFPPESTCVLLERDRQAYLGQEAVSCTGTQIVSTETSLLPSEITVQEEGDVSIRVVNNTDKCMDTVMLRYKTYLQQTEMYIGGVTNELRLENLAPGEVCYITPPYYVKDYSKIVFVGLDE